MRYVCFILALFFLVSVPFMPVLAADEEPAPEPEELPEAAEGYVPDEYQALDDPEGEEQIEDLLFLLEQLRAGINLVFLGVILLAGVLLGCFAGITVIKMWGV